VAVVSWTDNLRDAWAVALSEILSTVDSFRSTSEADWSEYDCVFTDENPLSFDARNTADSYQADRFEYRWAQNFASHLDVFVILGSPTQQRSQSFIGAWPERSVGGDWSEDVPHHVMEVTAHVVGRHVTRVRGVDEVLSGAVDQSLATVAKRRTEHVVYELHKSVSGAADDAPDPRPLLLGPSDRPLAVTWTRESGASVWVIPEDAESVMTMVRAAFAEWNERDAKRYPVLPDWDQDRRFRTARELALLDELKEVEDLFDRSREAHEAKVVELRGRLDDAAGTDGSDRRALLRADGDELERAVEKALADLGFLVQAMDKVHTASRREDFRLSDPGDSEWLAICEVKGYKGGAGLDALRQVEHHAGLFARDEGKLPSKWVIINAQRLQDPGTREVPYVTRTDDIGSLEDTGGLVVDTRALFEALQLVEGGLRSRDEVRALLRESTGVLVTCPPSALETGPPAAS
jgi:hypothetical protein